MRIDHAQGTTTLRCAPKRVAVFDLASLDILDALGVEIAGVPKANFPSYLDRYSADRYANIGTLFEPDYDALRAARPDLIIVAARSSAKYAELSKVAPTIDLSTNTSSFLASVTQNILLLGHLFGRQAEAAERSERMLTATRVLQRQGAKAGTGLLLFVVGRGVVPQPPKTRFGIVYELAGIASTMTMADLPPTQQRAPRGQPAPAAGAPEAAAAEQARAAQAAQQAARLASLLARNDPDWLFVLDRNAAVEGLSVAGKLLAENAAIVKTNAWAKQQVIHLDAPNWYLVGGGLTALESSIVQIGAAFK